MAASTRKLQGIMTGLKIYNYLGRHPGPNGYQIAKALRMKVGTAHSALARLERDGIVRSSISNNSRSTRLWYPKEWHKVIDWNLALEIWDKARQK